MKPLIIATDDPAIHNHASLGLENEAVLSQDGIQISRCFGIRRYDSVEDRFVVLVHLQRNPHCQDAAQNCRHDGADDGDECHAHGEELGACEEGGAEGESGNISAPAEDTEAGSPGLVPVWDTVT